jgi:tRNA(adenine34) deaminase
LPPRAAAADAGEVPIGAVVVHRGEIVAVAHNAPRALHDPTAHAEVLAIRAAAAALGRERLEDCDLWVSLEPCPMCAGAIMHARIARLYYAAPDPKGGAVAHGARLFDQPTCLHRPEVYAGLGEEGSRCCAIFQEPSLIRMGVPLPAPKARPRQGTGFSAAE